MATWTLTKHVDDDGPWTLREDGQPTETVRGHYEDWEALGHAEAVILRAAAADGRILWWRYSDDEDLGYATTGPAEG